MKTFFHMLCNSLFIGHPIIWCHTVWASARNFKLTKNKTKNLVFLSVFGFSFPSYPVNSTPCAFCQIIMYIVHWHQTGISGEYYETTGTLHNLRLCHDSILSHSVVSNTVQTSIVLNWEYQHPTVLKLMRVTPAERMEVCIKFEIFMWQNLWQAVI